jgi:hypothetical protein
MSSFINRYGKKVSWTEIVEIFAENFEEDFLLVHKIVRGIGK